MSAITGLVLFMGIKNKYSPVCIRAKERGKVPPLHRCWKNYGRDQSSTSMETAILIDGFRQSYEEHGIFYSTIVADGDSSVYHDIQENNPYGKFGVEVRKIGCKLIL